MATVPFIVLALQFLHPRNVIKYESVCKEWQELSKRRTSCLVAQRRKFLSRYLPGVDVGCLEAGTCRDLLRLFYGLQDACLSQHFVELPVVNCPAVHWFPACLLDRSGISIFTQEPIPPVNTLLMCFRFDGYNSLAFSGISTTSQAVRLAPLSSEFASLQAYGILTFASYNGFVVFEKDHCIHIWNGCDALDDTERLPCGTSYAISNRECCDQNPVSTALYHQAIGNTRPHHLTMNADFIAGEVCIDGFYVSFAVWSRHSKDIQSICSYDLYNVVDRPDSAMEHHVLVRSMQLTHDDKLFVAFAHGIIQLWDILPCQPVLLSTYQVAQGVLFVAAAPRSSFGLISTKDDEIVYRNRRGRNSKIPRTESQDIRPHLVRWDEAGCVTLVHRLPVGGYGHIHDIDIGFEVVECADFKETDEKLLLLACSTRKVHLWDAISGVLIWSHEMQVAPGSMREAQVRWGESWEIYLSRIAEDNKFTVTCWQPSMVVQESTQSASS